MSGPFELSAALRDADHVALASLDGDVEVWSTLKRKRLSRFSTILDFGGSRLAVVGTDQLIVATGSWDRKAVHAYFVTDGTDAWQRDGLGRVQQVVPAHDGDVVAVCFDRGPMQLLDASVGKTIGVVRGVRRFWQSPHSRVGIGVEAGRIVFLSTTDWRTHWRADVQGPYPMDVVFAADQIVVSMADSTFDPDQGAQVLGLDLDGQITWRYSTAAGTHVSRLGRDEEHGHWLGIQQQPDRLTPGALLRWSDSGDLVERVDVGHLGDCLFLFGGRHLATSAGSLVDTRTGVETPLVHR
jgi:hypothetical protein